MPALVVEDLQLGRQVVLVDVDRSVHPDPDRQRQQCAGDVTRVRRAFAFQRGEVELQLDVLFIQLGGEADDALEVLALLDVLADLGGQLVADVATGVFIDTRVRDLDVLDHRAARQGVLDDLAGRVDRTCRGERHAAGQGHAGKAGREKACFEHR